MRTAGGIRDREKHDDDGIMPNLGNSYTTAHNITAAFCLGDATRPTRPAGNPTQNPLVSCLPLCSFYVLLCGFASGVGKNNTIKTQFVVLSR